MQSSQFACPLVNTLFVSIVSAISWTLYETLLSTCVSETVVRFISQKNIHDDYNSISYSRRIFFSNRRRKNSIFPLHQLNRVREFQTFHFENMDLHRKFRSSVIRLWKKFRKIFEQSRVIYPLNNQKEWKQFNFLSEIDSSLHLAKNTHNNYNSIPFFGRVFFKRKTKEKKSNSIFPLYLRILLN